LRKRLSTSKKQRKNRDSLHPERISIRRAYPKNYLENSIQENINNNLFASYESNHGSVQGSLRKLVTRDNSIEMNNSIISAKSKETNKTSTLAGLKLRLIDKPLRGKMIYLQEENGSLNQKLLDMEEALKDTRDQLYREKDNYNKNLKVMEDKVKALQETVDILREEMKGKNDHILEQAGHIKELEEKMNSQIEDAKEKMQYLLGTITILENRQKERRSIAECSEYSNSKKMVTPRLQKNELYPEDYSCSEKIPSFIKFVPICHLDFDIKNTPNTKRGAGSNQFSNIDPKVITSRDVTIQETFRSIQKMMIEPPSIEELLKLVQRLKQENELLKVFKVKAERTRASAAKKSTILNKSACLASQIKHSDVFSTIQNFELGSPERDTGFMRSPYIQEDNPYIPTELKLGLQPSRIIRNNNLHPNLDSSFVFC